MKEIFATIYTKEKGKLELTEEEYNNFDAYSITYHRTDGPAVIHNDGSQEYWTDDKLHRTDGPAVIDNEGYQAYYINGKLHRLDGPAIIYHDGSQVYYINGKRHRLDGPAFIHSDGYQVYWIDDNLYTEAEFNQIINEVRKLSKTERLIDERWWVREL